MLKKMRITALFWCFFIGVGALFGGGFMICDPSGNPMGMNALLPYFQVLPFSSVLFQNFLFPGISLVIVNGLTQITTAVLLLKKSGIASKFVIACGIILMLWITIQFVIFPLNFMSTIYFVFGVLEALTGILLYREEKKAK